MHEHFIAYEAEPVDISSLRVRERRRRVVVTLRVSKRSTVTVTTRAGDRVIARSTRALLRGPEPFMFARPRSRKQIAVEVRATSLTGVSSSATRTPGPEVKRCGSPARGRVAGGRCRHGKAPRGGGTPRQGCQPADDPPTSPTRGPAGPRRRRGPAARATGPRCSVGSALAQPLGA